ncbi:MAG TPA: hypothetical protein GX707_09870 [Epulopiscium sp.]|nr:hypothetical protein [Candidatus Epulonipiscium sp.]
MENRILIDENWQQRIRDKIGVDNAYLPDSAIEQPDIITIAEANIISQIPDYEEIAMNGDSRVYLESTVVLECCILLCSSMGARLPKKETGPHAGHELYVNWDNKKAEFIEERDVLISKASGLDGNVSPTPLHFGVTYPKRGW